MKQEVETAPSETENKLVENEMLTLKKRSEWNESACIFFYHQSL